MARITCPWTNANPGLEEAGDEQEKVEAGSVM
jgi:hypothetical protein